MKRVLITGATGFLGRQVAEYLANLGVEAFGISRSHTAVPRLKRLFVGDVADGGFLYRVVGACQPTHVFHFAGELKGDPADPQRIFRVNIGGTVALMDAIEAEAREAVVIVAGSSAVYGRPIENPVSETAMLRPLTDYAASKVGQEYIALSRHLGRGTRVIRTRVFNLCGPGLLDTLVMSSVARQIALAEIGGPRVIAFGNVTPRRDFIDVRDAARAHVALARGGKAGEVYNVCSGTSRSIREGIDILMSLSRVELDVKPDPNLGSGSSEISEQIGSDVLIRGTTGWKPTVSFEQSLFDLLEDWRSKIGESET